MASIKNLLAELNDNHIAQKVTKFHDRAIAHYHLKQDKVDSFNEFSWIIGDYYNYHFKKCVSNGGNLSITEASGRAKELLKQEYRRRGQDIVSAYNDAHHVTNGSLFGILTIIAEGLKAEAVERWITKAFDSHVAPNSYEQKVDIIRQFFAHCGPGLSSSIDVNHPERYANDYEELIRAYLKGLRETSSIFDRL
jgi:hypothetical protein